jgi:hypothetical protein
VSEPTDDGLAEQAEPRADAAPRHRPVSGPRPSRSVALIALALSLIAIAFSGWAWLHPHRESTNPVTDQQAADARARACSAFNLVRNAVSLQTHADPGSDPIAAQAAAANARVALVGGATYLLAHLDPATPPELAASIRSFADQLQDLAMNAMAGVPGGDPVQAARLREEESTSTRLAESCK